MIQAEAISFSYNGKKVIRDVSLHLKKGDFMGVIGPNGAGKSTLLRLFSRILSPDRGSVAFSGRPARDMDEKEIARKLAVLPAETFYPYDFTVREIVKMGRAPHLGFWSEGNERDLMVVEVALDAVGIRDLAPRSIHSLSSGERQMVLLAQAMAQEPEVLLLDEPTVHLDIRHQVRLFRLLKEWNETGNLTVLVISHDLNIAAQFCGRLVLMKDGRLEKDGKPREVITEENLKNVYGIQARVIANPATGSPAILFE
ncbi:MAG: hypothetical protein A2902_05560 [Elusimicrobia bacterium RIFCSPLOWO2_01_FULL_64_13]|nr:MAG: hypothetical protein A2636_05480 [Elusimicrobia bacterium RIFCSPHIGHO2_01_FULL_64_10]OGR96967.1 MAG: hypothetical protein A2902_05560 [Elusimicrobia bacterium RIFCSPLOWO2_01_FULL_64_13]